MENIIFDEEKHEYSRDGIIIPSVTQVLSDVRIINYPKFVTNLRGSWIHKMIELSIKGSLDYSAITEEELEIISWFSEVAKDYEIGEVEYTVYSSVYNYAGRIDYVFMKGDDVIIVDLKTGTKKDNWFYIQLAAYCEAFEKSCDYGMILYQRTKNVEIIPIKELKSKYFPVFKAALEVYNFKVVGR